MTAKDHPKNLITRAQAGHRAAFEELAGLHCDRLTAVIRTRLRGGIKNELDVNDVAQETLLRAFRSLGRFQWKGHDSFARWLWSIAGHVVIDRVRHRQKLGFTSLGSEPPGPAVSPSKALRREERFQRLQEALEALPEDQRKVIRLARLEGLPLEEVAARMNRSANAVSHLLHRALRCLRNRFGDTESFHLPGRTFEGEETDHGL